MNKILNWLAISLFGFAAGLVFIFIGYLIIQAFLYVPMIFVFIFLFGAFIWAIHHVLSSDDLDL